MKIKSELKELKLPRILKIKSYSFNWLSGNYTAINLRSALMKILLTLFKIKLQIIS